MAILSFVRSFVRACVRACVNLWSFRDDDGFCGGSQLRLEDNGNLSKTLVDDLDKPLLMLAKLFKS